MIEGESDETEAILKPGLETEPAAGPTPMRVRVDAREPVEEMIGRLSALGLDPEPAFLRCGDYHVDRGAGGLLVVERKTAQDFLLSLLDGRLFAQCAWLSRERQAGRSPLLVIEGDLRAAAGNFDRRAILGALVSVALTWRIPILHTDSREETALLLAFAARQARAKDTEIFARRGFKPRRLRTRRLRFLQSLPGVGPKVAASLLSRFGSVAAIVAASASELATVPAVGSKRAAAIRDLLDGREEEGRKKGAAHLDDGKWPLGAPDRPVAPRPRPSPSLGARLLIPSRREGRG